MNWLKLDGLKVVRSGTVVMPALSVAWVFFAKRRPKISVRNLNRSSVIAADATKAVRCFSEELGQMFEIL